MHGWGGEISGGGCQHIAVLRLLTQAEITEAVAWGKPQESLEADDDTGLIINGRFTMSTGIAVPVFGEPTPYRGVDVWTEDTLLRWDWGDELEIYQGFDKNGARLKSERAFTPFAWPEYGYLASSILSFICGRRARRRDGNFGPRPAAIARSCNCCQVLRPVGIGSPRAAFAGPLADALSETLSLARR